MTSVELPVGALYTMDRSPVPTSGTVIPFARVSPLGKFRVDVVGFAVGAIGQQFIITAALPRFVTFIGATAAYQALFMGLYVVLGLRSFPSPWKAIATQALGNAVVGMIAFTIIEALPGVMERRRIGRRTRH